MAALTCRTTPGEIVLWPSGALTVGPSSWLHLVWLPTVFPGVKPAARNRLRSFRVVLH